MSRPMVTLLPKPPGLRQHGSGPSKPRHDKTPIACSACRKKKTKCNGGRPTCQHCTVAGRSACEYLGRSNGKAKMEGLRQETERLNCASASLTRENSALKQLLDRIKQGTDDEAYSTFLQLRSEPDLSVQDVAQDLMLHLLADTSEAGAESSVDFSMWTTEIEVTPIKAKSWTTVTGDELVSELIASWFMWDNAHVCPCIDRGALLESAGAGGAQFCSSFLINVMCAARCSASTGSGRDELKTAFLEEARQKYEEDSRACITNIQGLWLLALIAFADGQDRAASAYRYQALEMLRGMRLSERYKYLSERTDDDLREMRVIANMCWGIFISESMLSHSLSQDQLLIQPGFACRFPGWSHEATKDDNFDAANESHSARSIGPPMVRGSRHAAASLGVFFDAIREQNESPLVIPGSESDLRKRVDLLRRLCDFAMELPDSLHLIKNLTPQTFHLWVSISTAAYSLLRPLNIFSQLTPSQSVSDLLLEYCSFDAHLLERYMAVFDFRETPRLAMSNSFTAVIMLVPLLSNTRAQSLFVHLCRLMHRASRDIPRLRRKLRELPALVNAKGQELPVDLEYIFRDPELNRPDLEDIPMAFQIPTHGEMLQSLQGGGDSTKLLEDLAAAISKFSALSTLR